MYDFTVGVWFSRYGLPSETRTVGFCESVTVMSRASEEGEATARLSQARDRPGGIADERERALRDVVGGILETFGADDLGDRIERHLPLRKQCQAALDLQDTAHRSIEASHRDAPSLQCG